ncbi:hypothetical protein E8E14_009056 [Neopestalotiopsis sp. 37M]|nr:hypothetical protein E8E14_009056 [Neopestalotiopsis sp. 37M]
MERLPDEIWLEIVAGLGDSHHALASFARVSRKCYHLVHPQLYERLPPRGAAWHISPLLVRTLCENAAIANLVRDGDFSEAVKYDFQAHEVLPAVQACARLPDDFKSVLVTDAEESDVPDWGALLVALLPNLEELGIVIAFDQSPLKKALDVNRLPRLRALYAQHWDTENAADMWRLMPELFQVGAATLETFTGLSNDWSLGFSDAMTEPSDSTTATVAHNTLKDLTLENAVFDQPGLGRLLAACPRLTALRIHWGDACASDSDELDVPGTGWAIRQHSAATLEILMLNHIDHVAYGEVTEGIGSLQSMKRLRKLYLTHDLLAGVATGDSNGQGNPHSRDALVRLLPASLEELYLGDSGSPPPPHVLTTQVRRLVGARQEFPKLMRVQLSGLDPAGSGMDGWTDYGWTLETRAQDAIDDTTAELPPEVQRCTQASDTLAEVAIMMPCLVLLQRIQTRFLRMEFYKAFLSVCTA